MEEFETLGRLLGSVARRQGARIHRSVFGIGLGRGMPPVLWHIEKNNGCKQSDISKFTHTTPATVTVMLQTLEKNGFVERKTDESDQRCVRIYITQKGRDASEKGGEAVKKAEQELFSCLSDGEKDTLMNILLKLSKFLDEEGKEEE